MRIDVHFTPAGLAPGDVSGRPVIVIDALRATTTVVTALGNGAKAVIPTATPEEAVRVASNLEKNGVLLAGERKSLKIEGFNLGNSPVEMRPETVAGKTIVLATTNGTPALVAAAGGEPVLVGAAANFTATAERARALLQDGKDLIILCSGRERQFALEDAYTAGRLVKAIRKGLKPVELNDAAVVAVALTGVYKNWVEAFEASAAARQLEEVELSADVAFAAKPDRFQVVPQYLDRRIT
ncbi:MAG TPA: 2-phosphosulfolactate phosphatase [Gemmatimonadales bacterium]|nr:2-phosphosulfolactate phosphatase [Gemmatimonadales bacterium]